MNFRTRTIMIKVTVASIVLLLLAAFAPHAGAKEITVGVILPLTGKLARYGEMEKRAFLMAEDRLNQDGGISGTPVKLIIEDTKGISAVGEAVVEELISKHKACIISGGISSSVTWAVLKVVRKRKVPFLVTTASADRITEKGGRYVFRLAPPITDHLTALFSFLSNVAHAKTVGVIYEDTLFGQAEFRDFAAHCKKIGLDIVAQQAYAPETIDFSPLLSEIKNRTPDIFCMICSSVGNQASLIAKQAKRMNLDAKAYIGDGVIFTQPEFQALAGVASEYLLAPAVWASSVKYPEAADFERQWFTMYHEQADYHAVQAYAAMQVIGDALKRAGSISSDSLRDSLAQTDIPTIFGPVKFVSQGKKDQQNIAPTFLGQWINEKFTAVWPGSLTTGQYIYPIPSWGIYNGQSDAGEQ